MFAAARSALFGRRDRDFPPVSHPLVFVHPDNGKPATEFVPSFENQDKALDPAKFPVA